MLLENIQQRHKQDVELIENTHKYFERRASTPRAVLQVVVVNTLSMHVQGSREDAGGIDGPPGGASAEGVRRADGTAGGGDAEGGGRAIGASVSVSAQTGPGPAGPGPRGGETPRPAEVDAGLRASIDCYSNGD